MMNPNSAAKMNFTLYSTNGIDIQSAWMSTNALKEVCIILNTKNGFMLEESVA